MRAIEMRFTGLVSLIVFTAGLLVLPLIANAEPTGAKDVSSRQSGYKPKEGFVPDEETARSIAFVVLARIYGEKNIASQKPFTVSFRDGIWTIEGILPEDRAGGVALLRLAKSDGRVVFLSHGK